MAGDVELARLQETIGHHFTDSELLRRALTHSSRIGERSFERLEFLGDRVLGLVLSDALFHKYGEADEGELAPRFNRLVRKESCADVARMIDLGSALILSRSEDSHGGRDKTAILGDAMEAVIAAVYLDGGYPAASAMILRLWQALLEKAGDPALDPKSALQEWSQGLNLGIPDYETLDRTGPDHAPLFTIRVRVPNNGTAEGQGASKQAAEQEAARALLAQLGLIDG